ncbi:MAG: aminoacyl-tRNA hydrolase [Bacteroidota bacterium]
MKYLIVGLGNMGSEYDDTRHNIGFDVVDDMAGDNPWSSERLGDVCRVKHRGRTLLLLKPSTYMNRSGKAVQYWQKQEKVPLTNTLVIVDDLNLDFGKVRLRGKGSDGGHNGLKDINATIGNGYPRMRVGIGSDYSRGRQIDFVLGKWTGEERQLLKEIILHCADGARSFAAIGLQHTMSKFNR